MSIYEDILIRRKLVSKIKKNESFTQLPNFETTMLLIFESLDNYLEHRIDSDKVLQGILKDIHNSIESK